MNRVLLVVLLVALLGAAVYLVYVAVRGDPASILLLTPIGILAARLLSRRNKQVEATA